MNSTKKFQHFIARSGMLVVFLVVVLAANLIADRFFSTQNLISVGQSVATIGIVSCTMLFCLAAGDVDLSVGSTLALAGTTSVLVSNRFGSLGAGIASALAVGAVFGLFNGFIIAKCKVSALIATLATMQIARGLTNIFSEGKPISATAPNYDVLGSTSYFGVPLPIWLTAVCFLFFAFVLNRTLYGRNTLAVGGNPEAAFLAGINVNRTKMIIFMLSGMAAAFAGILGTSRMVIASNNAGDKLELQAISACVLGGVSLQGGVGTMSGALMGVLLMGIVENVMRLRGISTFYQMVVTGAILLLAVLFDRVRVKFMQS